MKAKEHYTWMGEDAWCKRLDTAVEKEEVSQADAVLIRKWIEFKTIHKNISPKRKLKLTEHCINFRKKWSRMDYQALTSDDWMLTAARILGSRYKQNTKSDYISIIKDFLRWGVKKEYITLLTTDDILEVSTPRGEAITKAPEELLSDNDIYAMLTHPDTGPMMGAMISILYWTGARIGEVLNLRWKDVVFGDMMLHIRITDTKSSIQRYAPCCEALEWVSQWRAKYPDVPGGPNGENFIFLSRGKYEWEPISYSNAYQRIVNLGRNVLGRHCNPHLYRHSDITNSAAKGTPDAVNKQIHWGNQSTTRLKTYLLLNNEQVEAAMYKRAGIERKAESEVPTGPIQCVFCRAMNTPNSAYCRVCGQPLTKSAEGRQKSLDEAIAYVQEHYSVDDMVRNMASVLGITEDAARKLLTGGL